MRWFSMCMVCMVLFFAGCSGEDGSVKARTEKLAAFTVQLPEGWKTNVPDSVECTRGRCLAGFTRLNSGSGSAISVSVIPSLGKTLKEIADESTGNQALHDASMRVVSQSETRIEYTGTIKGSEARLVATLNPEGQEVGILMLVGSDNEMEGIVNSLRMENRKLNFSSLR